MLTFLRVRDLAIISELEVELGSGLNVITGETGAGKSILIDALSLVLGERASPELVRTGAKQAEVEALFELGDDPEARARLEASGVEADGDLVVRRIVSANGRTRAYLNGSMASAGQLAAAVSGLVDISSQHEHHTLVDPASHLDYLDAFGRLDALRAEVAGAHRMLREADDALREAERAASQRSEREDLLRFQLREIDELDPTVGEDVELANERERLRHAERLGGAATGAEEALYSADGAVCEVLGRIAAEVRSAAAIDAALAPMAEGIAESAARLEDVARELATYTRGVTVDPERLSEVEDRLHRLKRLMRKYGGDIAGITAHRANVAAELAALDQAEERIAAHQAAREAALEKAAKAARALSAKRRTIADDLAKRISSELASLGMGGARVAGQIEPLAERGGELIVDGARLSETGIDRVEFLIAPNRGEEPRALRKIASGGELSRAMLAIKRVLAGVGRAGLYVFDEVDSGVGGAVAEVIGQKLADVARHHQVICITHLAQIAVYAERHYRVVKLVENDRTQSRIESLGKSERLEEIARMVGGLKITESHRRTAKEMLETARAARLYPRAVMSPIGRFAPSGLVMTELGSIDGVAHVERIDGASADRAAPPCLLIEVPHGADRRADYDALRARLVGDLPADLHVFFHVNTDVGAWDYGRRVAEKVVALSPERSALLVRSRIPRTFVDVNRLEDATEDLTKSGMTAGVAPYVRDPRDVALLLELHRAYVSLCERAFDLVCGNGGFALTPHTYGPRTMGIPTIDDTIVELLRRAHEPEAWASWPVRSEIDLITRSAAGVLMAPEGMSERVLEGYRALGYEAVENKTYHMHPSTQGWRWAERHPGQVFALEVRRDLLVSEYAPFDEMQVVPERAERVAGPLADAIDVWLRGR